MNNKTTILHFSDIHFGKINDTWKHDFNDENEKSILIKLLPPIQKDIDFFIITGDLVCKGSDSNQFNQAKIFIAEMMDKLQLKDPSKIIVIPGNHDISREGDVNLRMQHYYENFFTPLTNDLDWTGAVLPEKLFKVKFGDIKNNGGKFSNNQQLVFHYQEKQIIIITLHSQILDIPKKNKLKPEEWENDYGFIEEEQIKLISDQLGLIKSEIGETEYQSTLKIAVVHHNPIPVIRVGNSLNDFNLHETNCLINGPEVIHRLKKLDVPIILHGHRHQLSSYKLKDYIKIEKGSYDEFLLIGTRSLGRYEIDHYAGFNLIEINKNFSGYFIKLTNWKYKRGGGVGTWEKNIFNNSINSLKNNTEMPINFINSTEGLSGLSLKLLNSEKGAVMMHNHISASWYYYKDTKENKLIESKKANSSISILDLPKIDSDMYTDPFRRLWKSILDNNSLLENIYELMTTQVAKNNPKFNKFKDTIIRSIEEGYYTQELLDYLRNSIGSYLNSQILIDFLNSFCHFEHLRYRTYIMELWKLGVNPNYRVSKTIYFWNKNHYCHTKYSEKDISEATANKFDWLLRSLISYKGLTKVKIGWQPFAFHEFIGQSIATVLSDDNSYSSDIFFGWDNDLLKNIELNENGISVINLPGNFWNQELGEVTKEFRLVLTKSIYPITRRLLSDFPILENGRIYKSNIELIAKIYKLEYLLDPDYWKPFTLAEDEGQKKITLEKINNLYNTVLLDHNKEQIYSNDNKHRVVFLQWEKIDYKFILDNWPQE